MDIKKNKHHDPEMDEEDLNLVFSVHEEKHNKKEKHEKEDKNKLKENELHHHVLDKNSIIHSQYSEDKPTPAKKKVNHGRKDDKISHARSSNGEKRYKTYSGFYGFGNGEDQMNEEEQKSRIANRPTNGMDKNEVDNGLDIYDWNNPDND